MTISPSKLSHETIDLFGRVYELERAPGNDMGERIARGGTAGRDAALSALEEHRAEVVQALRAAALRLWRETQEPVCVNQIRHVLAELEYDGDPRILGAAFPKSEWLAVGWTVVSGSAANARPVRTFVPRAIVRS